MATLRLEHSRAFSELKSSLASAGTLGYFDDARTLIIADASSFRLILTKYLFRNSKEKQELE